jgi:hypothetical protein
MEIISCNFGTNSISLKLLEANLLFMTVYCVSTSLSI